MKLLTWIKVTIALIISFFIGWFIKKAPAGQASQDAKKEPLKVKDIIKKDQKTWNEIEEKLKEKDHEKTISTIVNDAGGVIHDQPVTIHRTGEFDINDR